MLQLRGVLLNLLKGKGKNEKTDQSFKPMSVVSVRRSCAFLLVKDVTHTTEECLLVLSCDHCAVVKMETKIS